MLMDWASCLESRAKYFYSVSRVCALLNVTLSQRKTSIFVLDKELSIEVVAV